MTEPYDPKHHQPPSAPPPSPGGPPPLPYGQPQYGQPQYGQPQYGQPQYGQPQQPPYGQPPYGQPQYGQPEYGPSYGQPQPPQYGEPFAVVPAPTPPAAKRRAPLIASLVAVVALAGGGAITYVALSDSSDSGAASPKAAVQNAIDDLQNSDLVGLLDDLAPGEREAIANPLNDDITALKRLHVLTDTADPSNVPGFTFTAKDFTYGAPVVINDHVQIVPITGGTVDLAGDFSKLPFTDEFRKVVDPSTGSDTEHITVGENGPVRIATVESGGRWYPSLAYTAADDAADHKAPAASDAIPAIGSSSAEAAVRDTIDALLKGDARTAIGHMSPTEAGALHDYGGMLLKNIPSFGGSGVRIDTLDLDTSALSGGATQVTLKKLVLSMHGEPFTLAVDGSCISVTIAGHAKKFCAADAAQLATAGFFGQSCSGGGSVDSDGNTHTYPDQCTGPKLTQAQKDAFTHLFSGLVKIGLATSQVDGQWYVDPLRSGAGLYTTMLQGMEGNDLLELAKLGK